MGKTIETQLTADSSQLRTEYAKAEKATAAYEKRVAASQGLARKAALDNVRALQLEASGRSAAADALRKEAALHENARKLAQQAGISEQGAIGILRRKLDLETKITEQKARAARISSAGVALPEIRLTPQSLATIEKGAAQTKELRRQTLLAGKAGNNGALGFLAFSQAVEDAQYGIRGVLNNIPQMILGFGLGAGLAGALSLAAVGAVVLYPILKRLYGSLDNERIQKAAEEWGRVFEEGNKVANQLRDQRDISAQMVEFVRSRTAATQGELTMHDGMIKSMEREIALRGTAASLAEELAGAERRAAEARGEDASNFSEDSRRREIEGLQADLEARQKIGDQAFEEAERLRQAQAAIAQQYAKEVSVQEDRIIALTSDLAGAAANIAGAQKELEDKGLKGAEKGVIKSNLRNSQAFADKIKAELEKLKAERDALTALSETQAAKTEGNRDALSSRINASYEEVEAIKLLIDQRKKLFAIQRAEEEAAAAKDAAKLATIKQNFAEETRIIEARASGNEALESSLERQRDIEQLKLRLMEEQQLTAEQALALATRRVDAETAAAKAQANAAKLRQRADSRKDFAGEMLVLRLAATGREKAAEALKKELEIRKQGKDLADSLGVTEERGLKLARQREALERRIEEQKKGSSQRRGIYKLTAEESAARARERGGRASLGRGYNTNLGGRVGFNRERLGGLRDSAAQRAERLSRTDPAARDRAAAAQYYERSIGAQEAMVQIFNSLGVV